MFMCVQRVKCLHTSLYIIPEGTTINAVALVQTSQQMCEGDIE